MIVLWILRITKGKRGIRNINNWSRLELLGGMQVGPEAYRRQMVIFLTFKNSSSTDVSHYVIGSMFAEVHRGKSRGKKRLKTII